MAHNRQAHAETFVLPGNRAVSLSKAIEDMRQELRADAFTVVTDGDFNLGIRAFHLNFHVAVNRSELNGIREQVPDDLLQTIGVSQNRPRMFEHSRQLNL